MALIRQSDISKPVAEAIVYRLGDLVREGQTLREKTKSEADAMLASARAERDRLISTAREEGLRLGREEGYREGHTKGTAEGREQAIAAASAELKTLLQTWTRTIDAFEASRDALLLEARTEVLRLACEIAELVVKRSVELKPDTVVDQIDAALAMVVRPTKVRLAISPDDKPLIEASLPGLLARHANATHVDIVEDAAMPRGSATLRTLGGAIDAQLSTQLARIIDAVLPRSTASASALSAAEPATQLPTQLPTEPPSEPTA
ncbi:MAG TPA: FliH/SctL family protein [Phycisphaerales bacterium]